MDKEQEMGKRDSKDKEQGLKSQNLIFFIAYRLNKLECHVTMGWQGFLVTNTLVKWTLLVSSKK